MILLSRLGLWLIGSKAGIIVAGLVLAALFGAVWKLDHDRIARNRLEATLAERGKWQVELARLTEERRAERLRDEEQLRRIGTELADTRMQLRDQRDGFDRDMLQQQREDEASGTPSSDFDTRFLRIIR